MLTWSIQKIELPLRYTWKISRNASESKTNLLVTVSDGEHRGTGEAAPNIRYGETPEKLLEEFRILAGRLPARQAGLEMFAGMIDPLSPSKALRFAIESAFVHFISSSLAAPVSGLLHLPPPSPAFTAYTIPIMDPGAMQKFYAEYRLERFRFIKLKVGSDSAWDAVSHLASFCSQPMMIDANEAFTDPDACIRWMEKIKSFHIEFIEQPMPASMTTEAVYLKKHAPLPLMADESVTFDPDFGFITRAFDGINMKLMKAGGYLNGIRILKEARKLGLKTMIGCMVETSLGIASALNLGSLADYKDLDSFLLLKDEPFHLVEEQDGALRLRPGTDGGG